MAKKEETKTVLERVYNVPLRREYMKAPNWKRTPKAVRALREFIAKHMKSEDVLLGKYANKFLWKNGIKNPPHHVKVKAVKDEKGRVTVELLELPSSAKREQAAIKENEERKQEKGAKAEEAKKSEKKEDISAEKVEEAKKEKEGEVIAIQKEEIKDLKEESKRHHHHPGQKQPKGPRFQETHPTAPRSQ